MKLRFLVCASILLFLYVTSLGSGPALGQLPTATLNGTVSDAQGGAIPSARVVLTNQGTGVTRETTSGSAGEYVFANVPAGDYTVRVEKSGFATKEFKDIVLEVGRATTLDAALKVATKAEVVTVTGGEVQVELTQSEVQGLVGSQTIENLPLNGRNFLELAYLLPGNRAATTFDPTKTNTLEVSSAGAFGRGGNITVDGGDNNDEVVGGTLTNFPEDGIEEFQIATNKFTAEVGRSGSSIINIVTKSGTNDLHGSLFDFFRQKTLQGLPATFDRSLPTPRFIRDQFGGSIGGPIVRDKFFWFTAPEYLWQDHAVPAGVRDFTTNTVIGGSAPAFVHDFRWTNRADFKRGENDSFSARYTFERSLDIDNGSLRRPAGSAANRQQSLNRYNSILGDWTRTLSSRQVNSFIFHIDYFLNSIPSFAPNNPITNPTGLAVGNEIRFPSLQDGANFRIPQSTKFNRYQIRDTLSWVTGRHTVRFGGEWQHLNTFALFDLFGSGSIFTTEDFATQDRDADGVTDDRDIPIAVAIKSAAPSRPPIVPFYPNMYFGSFVQDDWRALSNLTFNLGLRWEFDDVLGDASNLHPCASLTAPDNTCEYIENILGTHSGRDFKQFGPRFGFAWDPLKHGQTVIRGGYGIYYDRVVTEVPLLELLLNGRILPLAAFNGSVCSNVGGDCSKLGALFDAGTPTLLAPFSGGSAVFGIGVNHIPHNAKRPRVQQFTFGVQQQFATNWLISADGVHDFGQHFLLGRFLRTTTSTSPLITCPNGVDPCTVTDPLTGRSDNVTDIESAAESWYDGLLVSVQKRPTPFDMFGHSWSLGLNLSYTLSKTFNFSNDDQIPFNGAEDQVDLIERVSNLRLEKGYAPTDERHSFALYGVLQAPWNLSISPIMKVSSGVPMDSLVPSLSSRLPIIPRNALGREIQTGADLNRVIDIWNALPACGTTLPAPSPCNTAVVGKAGTLILPHVNPNLRFGTPFQSFDMSVVKKFSINERQNFQFIAQVFNLFNVTNIRGSNNNNYSGFVNNITAPNFNQAVNTAGKFFGDGGPRAFQFALRYSF